MAERNIIKINIFAILVITAYGSTQNESKQNQKSELQQASENIVSRNDETQPERYVLLPSNYYIPQTYQLSQNQNYESQVNQIPITVDSSEKKILQPIYRVPLDTSKYLPTQTPKESQINYSNQANYPYLYTVAKISPPSPSYTSTVEPVSTYYEGIPKKYQYGYRVSNPYTGTEFGHSEVNNGHTAKGYYHVLLPDGRLQNVKYWAGPSGYHASITYEDKY